MCVEISCLFRNVSNSVRLKKSKSGTQELPTYSVLNVSSWGVLQREAFPSL